MRTYLNIHRWNFIKHLFYGFDRSLKRELCYQCVICFQEWKYKYLKIRSIVRNNATFPNFYLRNNIKSLPFYAIVTLQKLTCILNLCMHKKLNLYRSILFVSLAISFKEKINYTYSVYVINEFNKPINKKFIRKISFIQVEIFIENY